jgi:hypothetical protein
MGEYRWMTYAQAAKYLPAAKAAKVSEVARSQRGFMGQYRLAKTSKAMRDRPVRNYAQSWGQRRRGFLRRHLSQYAQKKTYRRWLALVMWAYRPGPPPSA